MSRQVNLAAGVDNSRQVDASKHTSRSVDLA